jgi:hypothetical protein
LRPAIGIGGRRKTLQNAEAALQIARIGINMVNDLPSLPVFLILRGLGYPDVAVS